MSSNQRSLKTTSQLHTCALLCMERTISNLRRPRRGPINPTAPVNLPPCPPHRLCQPVPMFTPPPLSTCPTDTAQVCGSSIPDRARCCPSRHDEAASFDFHPLCSFPLLFCCRRCCFWHCRCNGCSCMQLRLCSPSSCCCCCYPCCRSSRRCAAIFAIASAAARHPYTTDGGYFLSRCRLDGMDAALFSGT